MRRNFSRKRIQEILNLEKFNNKQPVEPKVEQTPQIVEESSTDLDTRPLRRSTRERLVPERYGFLVTTQGDIILVDQDEPRTYLEAVESSDTEKCPKWIPCQKTKYGPWSNHLKGLNPSGASGFSRRKPTWMAMYKRTRGD